MVNNLHRAVVIDQLPEVPLNLGVEIADPNDVFLLALALASNANFLVTGDHRARLLELGVIGQAKIVTPSEFCASML